MDSSPLIRISRPQLASLLVSSVPGAQRTGVLELVVQMNAEWVDVRGLRDYLSFWDHTYGRLSQAGLPSYAQRKYGRLKLSQVRAGSWEAVVTAALAQGPAAAVTVVVGLVLKYLPAIVSSAGGAYRDFEEGRLTREKRRQLRLQIAAEEKQLARHKPELDQLVAMIDALIAANPREAHRAAKFSAKHVKGVHLQSGSERPESDRAR